MPEATKSVLEINYDIKCEIDITPTGDTPTWADMGHIFSNLAQSLNEVLVQMSYLADKGWGSTEVTGGQYTVTLTGHVRKGDPASDYFNSKAVKYNWGEARKTKLRITDGTGTIIWGVTLANITPAGGEANQPNAFTVTIHGNGEPTFEGED